MEGWSTGTLGCYSIFPSTLIFRVHLPSKLIDFQKIKFRQALKTEIPNAAFWQNSGFFFGHPSF